MLGKRLVLSCVSNTMMRASSVLSALRFYNDGYVNIGSFNCSGASSFGSRKFDRPASSFGSRDKFSSNKFGGFEGKDMRPPSFEDLPEIVKDLYVEHPDIANMSDEALSAILQEGEMNIAGAAPLPKPITSFDHVAIPPGLLSLFTSMGFTGPSGIQKISWPVAMSGRDLVAIAETGSGKTLGFLVPMVLHIKHQTQTDSRSPKALVLVPTRELCIQITNEFKKFFGSSGVRAAALYGGSDKGGQIAALRRNPEVIIATPGRLIDLVQTGAVSLAEVSFATLDEADLMLDMGFEDQLKSVLDQVRPDRQMVMFSATWPREVRALAAQYCKSKPVKVTVGSEDLTANPRIMHDIVCVGHESELEAAFAQWTVEHPTFKDETSIVFCRTKKAVEDVCSYLRWKHNLEAAALHGDKTQAQRDSMLNDFRSGRVKCLVATDVAARGLDVKGVQRVVNFGNPNTISTFIHRCGRTARAGANGSATTFFTFGGTKGDSQLASELCELLVKVGQQPPQDLLDLTKRQSSFGGGFGSKSRSGGGGYKGNDGGYKRPYNRR